MSSVKNINSRVQQKHDIEVNWNKAVNFIPLLGELILYDPDENYSYTRFKVGDGIKVAKDLPFVMIDAMQVMHGADTLASLLNMYMLQIDYDLLAFNTKELVFIKRDMANTALLGIAVLGDMILGQN